MGVGGGGAGTNLDKGRDFTAVRSMPTRGIPGQTEKDETL